MVHKKFPINPVFPGCINTKNPPSMQPVESKTKNGMGLRDLCHTAVLATVSLRP